MTKQYTTPQLTVHGSVESITQMFGSSNSNDFLFFSGGAAASGHGDKNYKVTGTTANGFTAKSCHGGSCNL
jgi:hypothetical protein